MAYASYSPGGRGGVGKNTISENAGDVGRRAMLKGRGNRGGGPGVTQQRVNHVRSHERVTVGDGGLAVVRADVAEVLYGVRAVNGTRCRPCSK